MTPGEVERIKGLARRATPGPWQWVDDETDLPCTPDHPCPAEYHDLSLRTVEHFPTESVGPLPRFITSAVEEIRQVEVGMGEWASPDAEYIQAASPEVVLALIAALEEARG